MINVTPGCKHTYWHQEQQSMQWWACGADADSMQGSEKIPYFGDSARWLSQKPAPLGGVFSFTARPASSKLSEDPSLLNGPTYIPDHVHVRARSEAAGRCLCPAVVDQETVQTVTAPEATVSLFPVYLFCSEFNRTVRTNVVGFLTLHSSIFLC